MKIILINIFVLLLFSNHIYSQTHGAVFIKVTFVDLNIEIFFSLPCDYFDSAFSKNEYQFIQIKNKSDLILFGNAFKKFY